MKYAHRNEVERKTTESHLMILKIGVHLLNVPAKYQIHLNNLWAFKQVTGI
jgi:hypothetical protein